MASWMARSAFGLILAVIPRGVVGILHAIDNTAEIGQPYGRSIAIGHDQPGIIDGFEKLSGRLKRHGALRAVKHSGRQIDVAIVQRVVDFIDADLPRRHFVRIQLNMYGVFRRPIHLHFRHAIDRRNALRNQSFGVFIDRGQAAASPTKRKVEYRLVGRVDLADRGRGRHVGGQLLRRPA